MDVINILAKPLAYLFNSSLNSGVFFDKLKCARVIPLYKKGPTDDVGNYRPIISSINI